MKESGERLEERREGVRQRRSCWLKRRAEFRKLKVENPVDDRGQKLALEVQSSLKLSTLHRPRAAQSSLSVPETRTLEGRASVKLESRSERK